MSVALIEAMARDLPVIATDVFGTKEAIVYGESGVLIRLGNVPHLTRAIILVLSYSIQAKLMGTAEQDRMPLCFRAEK
jgi:glycosyltransferase involved in cell wall biosynthesis